MNAQLINQIAKKKKELESGKNEVLRSKENLGFFGFRKVKEDAFVKIAAKVQFYVDLSLELRKKHPEFGGLPPTELSEKPKGQFVPIEKTAAIDQQRQLYAAARSALIDPAYADQILGELIDWHDAFVRHFVVAERNGPRVRAKVIFGSNASTGDPDPQANLRLTYALQGSATLVGALGAAADRSGDADKARRYRAKADSIKDLCLAIAERFYLDYADPRHPGRYFLFPGGDSEIDALLGLSHNNSQSYLIEGMAALAELDRELWQPRLRKLLAFIKTQRDPTSGLLHEFDFDTEDSQFPYEAVSEMEDFRWQSQEKHETVILGHTLAGAYTWSARLIADSSNPSKLQDMTALVEDFVKTMNAVNGIKESGLPANGFQLTLDGNRPCIPMVNWSDGAWQAELLWQFLLHADRAGVDLSRFQVNAESTTLTLDCLLAKGFDYHDEKLFNGVTYVTEDYKIEEGDRLVGRQEAAPINHAADTLRDLDFNLREITATCKHNYVENEIKSFVHQILGFFDKHVDVEQILQCLVDDRLEIDFPDATIRSIKDFRKWYKDVEAKCEWNLHDLDKLDVKCREHGGYDVDVVLRWQAKSRGEKLISIYRAEQQWFLVESENGPKIARYKAILTQLPSPKFFESREPTDGASGDQESPSDPKMPLQSGPTTTSSGGNPARIEPPSCHGYYDLNEAVAINDLIAAERMLKQGWDANKRDAFGFTPLMVAAGLGYVQMCQILLNAGADPTMVDKTMGATALHKAAQSGVVDVARLLLNHGAFVDAQAPTLGNTPLIDAVRHKRPAMVRYLLEQGARLEIKNRPGATAFDFAKSDVERGAAAGKKIMKLLEERRTRDEEAARSQQLMAAVTVQEKNVVEVLRLINSGAPLDEKAPLASEIWSECFSESRIDGSIAGYTPLLATCMKVDSGDIVRALLEAGANPRLVAEMIRATPGHKAGYQGHAAAAKALVEDGRFEIDAQGPYNGYTALHDAIWHGHIEAARVFIDAGARLDLRTHTGHTPLELATDYGYPEIADLIRRKLASSVK